MGSMSLGSRLAAVLAPLAFVIGLAPGGAAVAATPTTLVISAPAAYAGAGTTLSATLRDSGGLPVADAAVVLERATRGAWQPLATVTTDADGRATVPTIVARVAADNAVRASYAGDAAHDPAAGQTTLRIVRRSATVTLGAPRRVVDERAITIRVRWRTGNGTPVAGRATLYRALRGGPYRPFASITTGSQGLGQLRTRPRLDTRYVVRTPALDWVAAGRSGSRFVDNRPPGRPVALPRKAPRPRAIPAQARATRAGAAVTISTIDDARWRQMVGVTWHSGCPVGRDDLRVVRVNYWDYHGYRRRGELVANADAARAMGAALAEMYRRHLPIRAMYRVDRFGWSGRSRGGNDYASMDAGNTSAFNCRDVTGRPGVRSPHAWGRALDVNTWENPYRSARGIVPNTWWQPRSHPRVAWRSRSHVVVRLMARHGLRWTYGVGDTQHFDYVGSRARAAVPPTSCRRYCD